MPNLERMRTGLITGTGQELENTARLFDGIRERSNGQPAETYSLTTAASGGSMRFDNFISPYIVLPAQEVRSGRDNKLTRRVGVQMCLSYLAMRNIGDRLPSRTPTPDAVGFYGHPIALDSEAPAAIKEGRAEVVSTASGNDLTIFRWTDMNIAANFPQMGTVGTKHEWQDWQTFSCYPPEALTLEMMRYHSNRLAMSAARRIKIEKALKDRSLNPR